MNSLHDEGHFLHYWTAGCWDGEDYLQETREQLDSWGVKYNDVPVFKPLYDVWIDDKAAGGMIMKKILMVIYQTLNQVLRRK